MSLSKPLTLRHLCHLLNNILGLFYHRGENGHNLDIWVLRLRQGQMQIFLCLKVGKSLYFQKWGLNRVHETERSVFPIPRVFGMCRRRFLCKVEKGVALTTGYIFVCKRWKRVPFLLHGGVVNSPRFCLFFPFVNVESRDTAHGWWGSVGINCA